MAVLVIGWLNTYFMIFGERNIKFLIYGVMMEICCEMWPLKIKQRLLAPVIAGVRKSFSLSQGLSSVHCYLKYIFIFSTGYYWLMYKDGRHVTASFHCTKMKPKQKNRRCYLTLLEQESAQWWLGSEAAIPSFRPLPIQPNREQQHWLRAHLLTHSCQSWCHTPVL